VTPMELQYLVGLCCLRRNPEAVKIILGDMVYDDAAGKRRDVDVTIMLEEADGSQRAFKALEVKKESKALDVAAVEQLCLKLIDMPAITHRAIVSASGYTEGARRKAERHGVELYGFIPWDNPISDDFPSWDGSPSPQIALRFSRSLLFWGDTRVRITTGGGPLSFDIPGTQALTTASGERHPKYGTMESYREDLLLRSTRILYKLEPAETFLRSAPMILHGPQKVARSTPWAQTHTMDVTTDNAFLEIANQILQITEATISGYLFWEWPVAETEYRLLRRVGDGAVYAGAAVAPGRVAGELLCFVLDPTSPVCGVHFVQLTEAQQKILRQVDVSSETAQR